MAGRSSSSPECSRRCSRRAAGPAVSGRQGRAQRRELPGQARTSRRAWASPGTSSATPRPAFAAASGMFYDVLKAEDNLQFNGQAPFFALGVPELQRARRRLHFRPRHSVQSVRGGRRAQSVPIEAGQPQRGFRRCRRPAHRRRQSVLRGSEPQDASHLPVQPHASSNSSPTT